MKYLNKKRAIAIFITASFVLLTFTGCVKKNNNEITPSNNNEIKTEEVIKNEENNTVVESGGTLTDSYVDSIVEEEVPITTNKEIMTEGEVVSYFEDIEAKVNSYATSENFNSLKDKASSLFITTVDFIFYDGEIKGVTFDSLSNDAKLKILNIAKRIDTTIMSKWPTYKEDIKTTSGNVYDSVSTKIGEGIDYVDSKLEENIGTEDYNSLKESANEAVEDIKDAASGIWEDTKEVGGKAKDKVKSWYEEFKNKHSN